jgi:hypothetical protein
LKLVSGEGFDLLLIAFRELLMSVTCLAAPGILRPGSFDLLSMKKIIEIHDALR